MRIVFKDVKYKGKSMVKYIDKDKTYCIEVREADKTVNKKVAFIHEGEEMQNCIACIDYKPEEWDAVVAFQTEVQITAEDMDDIMVGALEGGINYWCNRAAVPEKEAYLGEYASEQISRGGTLVLHDYEDERDHVLTRDKLLAGIKLYLQNPHPYDITEGTRTGFKLDTCQADAVVCDMIIQYAIFGEVIYG